MIHDFFQTLRQPEYIHILLNPLPVYATAMGVVGLLLALLIRSRAAQGVGLAIILIGCLSIWPVMEYGDRAADRVQSMANSEGNKWLQEHDRRADVAPWVFYPTGAIAIVAILALWKLPKTGQWLTYVALLGAVLALGVGGWISQAGGKIRHSEFQHGPPPAEHSGKSQLEGEPPREPRVSTVTP